MAVKDLSLIANFDVRKSRLPEGYTEVEYIHFDGTKTAFALLDTIVCNTDRIFYRFHPTIYSSSISYYMLFCSGTASGSYFVYIIPTGASTIKYVFNNASANASTFTIGVNQLLEFDINFLNKTYTVNGKVLSGTSSARTIGTTYKTIGSGATVSTTSSATGQFYQFTHYRNGEVIHDYVPCVNPDGIAGVFDINTETFIQNTKTDATGITPGPPI